MIKFGYLRESEESARKAGKDPTTGIHRTGLETYLAVIFPEINDWVHDKCIPNTGKLYRPDYRSESLKLIVEFDGLPHYQKPDVILKDEEKTRFYQQLGYKVVRIPYFIQLTNSVVKKWFGVNLDIELFPEDIASISVANLNTPAYMCPLGIKRCAKELLTVERQCRANIAALKAENNDVLSGYSLLKEAIEA